MSVKGRKFRRMGPKPEDRGHTRKGLFQLGRAVDRGHFPAGRAWGTRRARQLLAGAVAQAPAYTAAVQEEGCSRCGLEPHAWKGSQGKGYARGGGYYCCQLCADELECPCQE